MFDTLLFVAPHAVWGKFLERSLTLEGYRVVSVDSLDAVTEEMEEAEPNLIVLNAVGQPEGWLAEAEEMGWELPVIVLLGTPDAAEEIDEMPAGWHSLTAPFAFQDLLMVVQDVLYQRTLTGQAPFQLSAGLLEQVDAILTTLREDLRARCVVLSSSGGRLIKTAGVVDQGTAISLAALMSASFTATAKAAQLLGHADMFDSNLQESEGYGLYAIRLQNKLILSVAFSTKITVGMVRHYVAQAALDILELLARDARRTDNGEDFEMDADFRHTVNRALGDILGD
jgi:DNA-binding response OmpR family regulator